MKISVICTVALGALVSANEDSELLPAGDSTGSHVYAKANAELLKLLSAPTEYGPIKRSTAGSTCPEIWREVAADLQRSFHGCSRKASTSGSLFMMLEVTQA